MVQCHVVFISMLLCFYVCWKSFRFENTVNIYYLNWLPISKCRITKWSECTSFSNVCTYKTIYGPCFGKNKFLSHIQFIVSHMETFGYGVDIHMFYQVYLCLKLCFIFIHIFKTQIHIQTQIHKNFILSLATSEVSQRVANNQFIVEKARLQKFVILLIIRGVSPK